MNMGTFVAGQGIFRLRARQKSFYSAYRSVARRLRRITICAMLLAFLIYSLSKLGLSRREMPGQPPAGDLLLVPNTLGSSLGSEQYARVEEPTATENDLDGVLYDSQFDLALSNMESATPGEMVARSLLQPIEGTGPEKMRELGLRFREYKRYFDVWEALHIVESCGRDGETFIRTDMIRSIRQHAEKRNRTVTGTDPNRLIHSYETYGSFLKDLQKLLASWTAPYLNDHVALHLQFKNAGRGIVLTGGNRQIRHLKTLIRSLRWVGCKLPIEVMYLDDLDLGVDYQVELETFDNVIARPIAPLVNNEGWNLAGWALKPFAILLSSFREVIFIDADSLFFVDPETLLNDGTYESTGALFFKDRLIFPESRKAWLQRMLPRPISSRVMRSRLWTGESGHMQESGVVVVDKFRHYLALLMVCCLNGPEREGNKESGKVGMYDMVYGDKETFWIGWELVGDVDYAFHSGGVAALGTATPIADAAYTRVEYADDTAQVPLILGDRNPEEVRSRTMYMICSPQLLHLGTNNRPLWLNGGLLINKFDDADPTPNAFKDYVIEPAAVAKGEEQPWVLAANNVACLTSAEDHRKVLDYDEKLTLEKMISFTEEFL